MRPVTHEEGVVDAHIATLTASMFESLAIVSALAEQRLVDPLRVVAWAEMFARGLPSNLPPEVRTGVQSQLTSFATVLRSMATMPAGTPELRQ